MSTNPFGPSYGSVPPVANENPFSDQKANPYAAPEGGYGMAKPEYMGGVFRMGGNRLVLHKQAVLPQRCIKTGAPAEVSLSRTLYWHHPALILLVIFPGLLVYAIVALIVRKSAKFQFPVTHRARNKLRLRLAIGIISLLSAFGAMIGGFVVAEQVGNESLGGVGVLLFFCLFINSIVFFFLSRLVVPTKITDQFAVVKGISPEYLAMLPDWPYGPVVP